MRNLKTQSYHLQEIYSFYVRNGEQLNLRFFMTSKAQNLFYRFNFISYISVIKIKYISRTREKMPIDDPFKRKIARYHLLEKSVCRKCNCLNPPKAIKCRKCHSKQLRPKKKDLQK